MRAYEFPEIGTAIFTSTCEKCGRFVKADEEITLRRVGDNGWNPWYEPVSPNANCRRCGRVAMIWEGFE